MNALEQIPQQIVIGLSVGATYALVALGYTMVYGVLRLINFAHGEVYMVGAAAGLGLVEIGVRAGLPLAAVLGLALVGSMALCAILGLVIERLAYRPLRSRPRIVSLITAIGVSLLLQNLMQLKPLLGPSPRRYDESVTRVLNGPAISAGEWLTVTWSDLLNLGLAAAMMLGLSWVVLRTRIGLGLRAVSHRFDTAALMGVNTDRVIAFTFMAGSALAAVAGVVNGLRYNVEPLMGVGYGMKAFVAAVVGGIGSIPGAFLGALLIGLLEAFVKAYSPQQFTGLSDAVVFAVLIVVLLVKPTGLLGRTAPEKV